MNVNESNSRIRTLLSYSNLSQTDFCKKAGIQKSALSNYLNGDRKPNQLQLARIAEAFDVSPAWLMGFEVPMELHPVSKLSSFDRNLITKYHAAPKGIQDSINILLDIKKGD